MTQTIVQARITPEELMLMPDEAAFELVDGTLVERHLGAESSEIAVNVTVSLGGFLATHPLGRLFASDTGYQCFPDDRDKIKRADVSFVRFDRLPGGAAPKGYIKIPPDLAVEVISPNDTADEVDEKVVEYLRAGFRLIWVVSPPTKTVRIYRPRSAANGPISILTEEDTIGGEDVLPGFSCPVKAFFPGPPR